MPRKTVVRSAHSGKAVVLPAEAAEMAAPVQNGAAVRTTCLSVVIVPAPILKPVRQPSETL
jgi:hypothetical protein